MEIEFSNKIILITGASRGIGRAAALLFAGSGGTVIIHYNQDRIAAEKVLSSLPGVGHMIVQADLGDPGDLVRMAGEVAGKYGRIDILVNNAGIFEEQEMAGMSLERFTEYWGRTLAVNLTGPALLSHLVTKVMMANGGGRIVNVSSRGAFRGEPDTWAYGASKAGLNALGQSMAVALAKHGIFVFTLAPGFVDTDMSAHCLTGPRREAILGQSPMHLVAKPEEIARAILILAAEGNEYMTGCILDMNGASYLRT